MTVKKKQFTRGVTLRPDDVAFDGVSGELKVGLTSQKLQAYLDSASREIITADQVQSLSNKTIDVDNNTVSNIEVDNLKSGVLNTSTSLASASNLQVPSALAAKSYADSIGTTAQTNLDNHINDASDAHDASAISNVPAGTVAATDVQAAINELDGDIQGHITDAVDAHDASAISNVPAGNLAATDVQAALNELQGDIDTNASNLANHLSDAVDAHDASAISNIPAGSVAATDVQAAINELDGDIQGHITDASDAHDASAISVVPTGNLTSTDVQAALVEIQSQVDTLTGDVAGPASATDNAITRFDGTTGKLIQNSLVTISDTGAITNPAEVTLGVSTTQSTLTNAKMSNKFTLNEGVNDNTSGSNVTLVAKTDPICHLINAGLVSIDMIPPGDFGQTIILTNITGNDITINNETGATANRQIYTGTGASIIFKNKSSLLLKYSSQSSKWDVVGGSGAGGSQALDTFVQLYGLEQLNTWATGDNATFLGGGTLAGTFAYNTSTPLNGTNSYQYTQAAGSLDDYLASPVQSVPLRFRGNTATLLFSYTYDGGSSDIEAVVYDVTNATKLSIPANSLLPISSTTSSLYKLNFSIPSNCTQIRVGFQTKIANSGKILKFDDIQVSSNVTQYADPSTITEWQSNGATLIGAVTTPPTKGTVSVDIVRSRRVGDSLEINMEYNQTSVGGAAGSGAYLLTLPSGLSFNLNKVTANTTLTLDDTASDRTKIGEGYFQQASGIAVAASVFVYDATRMYVKFGPTTDATGTSASAQAGNPWSSANTAGAIFTANFGFRLNIMAPIAGWTASNPQIIAASDSFSSDTAQFAYASSAAFTLATLPNAPVGTFITWTYAINSNTATQTTTAPTQSASDMNVNGVRLFTRAYNAASTAASPARIAINVGRNFKGTSLNIYKAVSKATQGSLDFWGYNTTAAYGAMIKEYNESTGILLLDAGFNDTSSNTSRLFYYSDFTTQADGYVVINASKSPALVGVPEVLPRIATITDVKASGTSGGTATSGAYQTRTLNTLLDPSGILTSLTANQFVLSAGEYYIEAWSLAYQCDGHKNKIRNITDSTDAILGSSVRSSNTDSITNPALLAGYVTITASKTFELQHRVATTKATDGFGQAVSFGDSETYAMVKITKVK